MSELKKEIGYGSLFLIVICSIMGTGIYFLPSVGARISGPASIIAWLIMSVVAIYIAMCFAELTSMFPKAGGIYEFCKQAYGRFFSFIIGWTTFLSSNITIAMLVMGAIQYLLPYDVPLMKIGVSILFILIFNFIAYRGVKTSVTMLVTFAFITITTITLLVIPAFFKFNMSNLKPFFVFPAASIYFTIFFIAETFFGWESPTFLAGETKNGEQVVPKAIIYGTLFISGFSLLFIVAILGAVNWSTFGNAPAPLSLLAETFYGQTGTYIFTILVYLSIIGTVAAWIVTSPRLILSMAADKLFLRSAAEVHRHFHTPHRAILFQTIASIIFVTLASGYYSLMLEMLVPILLFLYCVLLLSLVVLRFKQPKLKRYFTVPFGKIGPFVIIIFFIAIFTSWILMSENAFHIMRNSFLFVLLGVPMYFLLELYYHPKTIRIVNDILAFITLYTERLALPMSVRKKILRLVGNIEGKAVLDFGCSVGTMTMHLAEEVGKKGKVYATDISEMDAGITQHRMDKKGHGHVTVIHDLQHHSRVHPEVPNVHVAVSVGSLSYVQDVKNVLKHINQRMKKGSKICFVEYDKFFDLIRTKDWLEDDKKIVKVFKNSGFKVSVKREQGFAWKYIFIYGKKYKGVR